MLRAGVDLMVRAGWGWVVLWLVTSADVSLAQASPQAEAKEHFERGVALYERGNMEGALAEFERAYKLSTAHELLFNLAQVHAQSHDYVRARSLFQRFLDEGGAEVSAEKKEQVHDEIVRLGTWIAELMVQSNVDGAQLWVDDAVVGRLPLAAPVPINAGVRRIRVDKPGYVRAEQVLKVAGLEVARLQLPLQPALNGVQGGEQRYTTVPDLTPCWIGTAVAGVFAGAAASFAVLALRADTVLSSKLDQFQPDPIEVDDLRARLQTYAYLGDGFGAAAFVAAAVAVFFLVDPPRKPVSRVATGQAHLNVRPGSEGFVLRGEF